MCVYICLLHVHRLIGTDYADRELLVLGVLKGAFAFTSGRGGCEDSLGSGGHGSSSCSSSGKRGKRAGGRGQEGGVTEMYI